MMLKNAVPRFGAWAVVALSACLMLGSFAPTARADTGLPAPEVIPGRVVSWGGPADLQDVMRPPADLNDAVAIAASDAPGSYTSLALRADGTVVGGV